MRYETKSAVIARKKTGEDTYNCLINLFDINDPHMSKEAPKECLEFENIDHADVMGLKLKYCLLGNDIVLNDLKVLEVTEDKENKTLQLSGEQDS